MTFARTARRLAAITCLVVLAACGKGSAIDNDLKALNQAGQNAMAAADVQQVMGKVQSAKTNEERAALMQEMSVSFGKAQAELKKPSMKSEEVGSIQARMASGFEKAGTGAKAAGDAFAKSASAELEKARLLIREGQQEFIAAGADMVKLAKQRNVDLNKKP